VSETLVVVEKSAHRVAFYDLTSGQLETTVPCPEFPPEMVVDREQRFAYVSHYGLPNSGTLGDGGAAILAIDLRARECVHELSCLPYGRIHGIRLDDRGRLFALSEGAGTLMVFADPRRDRRPGRAVPVGGLKSHLFALRPDGERAWCMNLLSHTVSRVEPFDAAASPVLVTPGSKPEGVCLSADGQRLFVTNRDDDTLVAVDPERMTVVAKAATGRDPTRVYELRDRRLLVAAFGAGEIWVTDPETLSPSARLPVGGAPIAVSVHPSQPLAYLSLDSDEIAILDTDRLEILSRFPTGREPDCSAVLTG
jgi:YVTN family beta-propeller protein